MSILSEPIRVRRRSHPVAAVPQRDGADPTGIDAPPIVRRGLVLLAALTLLLPINEAWTQIVGFPAAGLASVLLLAGAFVLIGLTCCARDPDALPRIERWVLVLGILTLVVWAAVEAWSAMGYGTDEGALQQGAAQALLHGHDPYGADLSSALYGWTASSQWLTYLLGGQMVHTFGYPSLPILIVAPFVALTHGGQGVSIAYVFVLVGLMVACFAALPDPLKSLSVVVCVGVTPLLAGALAGETEILAMLPLVLVAATWTRIGHDGRLGTPGALCAGCLGLAVCANQTAWFFAPFVVVGVGLIGAGRLPARHALRLVLRFCVVVLGVCLLINLPFIVWNPGAWAAGVAAPLTQHAIPLGQGLISFTAFARLGGGDLAMFGAAGATALVALLLLFVVYFRQLARAIFLLPLLPLFLSDRALAGYWMFAVPVILIAAVRADASAIDRSWQPARRLIRRWDPRAVVGAAAAIPVACLVVAFSARAPLVITIDGGPAATSSTQTHLRVTVTNTSDRPLAPAFFVAVGDRASALWPRVRGPVQLGPHRTATYVIRASDADAATIPGESYAVVATTRVPETVSSSATVGSSAGADW